MLKIYEYNGSRFQFKEGKQPKGYVEVKAGKPSNKGRETDNKAAEAAAKAAAEAAEKEAAEKAAAEAAEKAEAEKKAAESKSKGTTKAE